MRFLLGFNHFFDGWVHPGELAPGLFYFQIAKLRTDSLERLSMCCQLVNQHFLEGICALEASDTTLAPSGVVISTRMKLFNRVRV